MNLTLLLTEELFQISPENINLSKPVMRNNPLNKPSLNYKQKLVDEYGGNYDDQYIDTHVSTFNQPSFELIFNDLCAFGYLQRLSLENVTQINRSQEFIVNIKKLPGKRVTFLSQKERARLKIQSLQSKIYDLYFMNSAYDQDSNDVDLNNSSPEFFSLSKYLNPEG